MRCIAYEPGGPLTIAEADQPVPGEGEILIRIRAAGVNRPDLLQRAGLYPAPVGASPILGLEVAGEVAALGPPAHNSAQRWKVGDAVVALLSGGGYAEYATVPESAALPAPAGPSLIEAAALPETTFTVWANVFEAGALQPDETLLVQGGASGIGTTAIQMARAYGAHVFATAGSDEKRALCQSLGATRAINYRTEDFEAVLREAGGADVILDMIGAPYAQKNLNSLKERGRLVQIGFQQGSKVELDLMRLMLKRLTLTGSTLRSRAAGEKARLARQVEHNVWPWIAAGKFKPVIDSTYPLEDAEAAHARMQSGAHAGKIVLTM